MKLLHHLNFKLDFLEFELVVEIPSFEKLCLVVLHPTQSCANSLQPSLSISSPSQLQHLLLLHSSLITSH
jgi:hypothetical protein